MTIKEIKTKYPLSYKAYNKAVIVLADKDGIQGEVNLEEWWVNPPKEHDNLEKYITWNKKK